MSFSRKAILLALMTGFAVTGARPALSVPEADVLAEAQARFKRAYNAGGMIAVTQEVMACYAYGTSHLPKDGGNFNEKLRHNKLLKACLLLDLTAKNLDQGVRHALVSMGNKDPGPVTEYYEPDHYKPRLFLYSTALFPSAKAYEDYSEGAFEEITKNLNDHQDSGP